MPLPGKEKPEIAEPISTAAPRGQSGLPIIEPAEATVFGLRELNVWYGHKHAL
jgi:hypothetical protein